MRHTDLLTALAREPWAMLPDRLVQLTALAAAGDDVELAEVLAATKPKPAPQAGSIAVIPVYGVLYPRSFWGLGTVQLRNLVNQAVADPNIAGILLDIDSPGGSVYGTAELADAIHAARKVKPVWAVADNLAASAAYWVGAQAEVFNVSPSGDVGSIGVWLAHLDMSRALDAAGLKVTLISAGKYKTEGHPYGPLDDEAREHLQESVDDSYEQFLKAVSRGRGVSVADVRRGFGEGRLLSASQAVAVGMVNCIATFEQTLTAMQRAISGAATGRGRAAEDDAGMLADGTWTVTSTAEAPAAEPDPTPAAGAAADPDPAPPTDSETADTASGADAERSIRARLANLRRQVEILEIR